MRAYTKFCSAVILTALATSAGATGCEKWSRFASQDDYLEPHSVPAAKIGKHLSASEWSQGIEFKSTRHGKEVWLDITSYPGETTAAGGSRAIMMVGRLMDENFEKLVLAEAGKGIFVISEPELRAIGCRFIWGKEGGENPIALMRELFKALRWYEGDRPLSTAWNGSLFGDTNNAISLHSEVLMPEWAMSAVK